MWLELHQKGKLALIDFSGIVAVIPPVKGNGSLLMWSMDEFIEVDESAERIQALLAEYEIEIDEYANDE